MAFCRALCRHRCIWRAATVDLEVPSHSEIVLEGTITPAKPSGMGPLVTMGFYGLEEPSPLVRFHCMTQSAIR